MQSVAHINKLFSLFNLFKLLNALNKSINHSTNNSIIQIEGIKTFYRWDIFGLEGIRTFCLLGHILYLGVLGHFGLKNRTRKIDKIHRDFKLYQVFLCQTVLLFSQNLYYSQKELKHFGLQILGHFEFQVLSGFKHSFNNVFWGKMSQKKSDRKIYTKSSCVKIC